MNVFIYTLGIATALAGMALSHIGVTLLGLCVNVMGVIMLMSREKQNNEI